MKKHLVACCGANLSSKSALTSGDSRIIVKFFIESHAKTTTALNEPYELQEFCTEHVYVYVCIQVKRKNKLSKLNCNGIVFSNLNNHCG